MEVKHIIRITGRTATDYFDKTLYYSNGGLVYGLSPNTLEKEKWQTLKFDTKSEYISITSIKCHYSQKLKEV